MAAVYNNCFVNVTCIVRKLLIAWIVFELVMFLGAGARIPICVDYVCWWRLQWFDYLGLRTNV